METPIEIKFVGTHKNKPLYATSGSAGADLFADGPNPMTIFPGQAMLIPTGIALHIKDPSIGGFVFGRSGLALNHQISVASGVGVIDSDYTGEIFVSMRNSAEEDPYTVKPGDRIAQIIFLPVVMARFIQVEELPETARGSGGFGSTGG